MIMVVNGEGVSGSPALKHISLICAVFAVRNQTILKTCLFIRTILKEATDTQIGIVSTAGTECAQNSFLLVRRAIVCNKRVTLVYCSNILPTDFSS